MRAAVVVLVGVALVLAGCETPGDDASGDGPTTTIPGAGADAGGLGRAPLGPVDARVTPGSQADLSSRVGDRVYFGFDRYDLTTAARATLDRQAAWLRQFPNVAVTIEGHCDERGTREYNIALGHRRATAVKSYLVALGIPGSRIDTTSFGKERPSVAGSDQASWAENRRAVTVVN